MTNVPTDEVEVAEAEPVSVTAIRDAITKLVPQDENIVSNVTVHDGLADVMIRWRGLRWARMMAISNQSPEEMAARIDQDFRDWLRNTIKNMNEIPRHARVLNEMKTWLRQNPDKHEWLYQTSNKTTLAA